jgi:hypothetical protein
MRKAIIFLILAIFVGVVLPYLLQDRFEGMSITLPTSRGSPSPAPERQISTTSVIWFLRGLGVCFALIAIPCFSSTRHQA